MKHSRFLSATTTALAAVLLAAPLIVTPARPAAAQFGIGLSITIAPPELPVYEQPPLPGPGYIWTPGYWAYGEYGYYWVPGTWVLPPAIGLLWTPGYWGWNDGVYVFNRGYWGPHVGFYGGIDYGFGYGGFGYEGGEWRGGEFAYNRVVNNFGGVHITNVYERNVTIVNERHVSFNGPNGINLRPRPEELAVARERHIDPLPLQIQHQQMASQNRALLASVNHGRPAIAATARPAAFSGPGVVPARGGAAFRNPAPAQHWGNYGAAPHPVGEPMTRPAPGPMQRPAYPQMPQRPAYPQAQHPGYTPGAHPGYGQRAPAPMEPRPIPAPASMAPRPMESQPMAPRPIEPRPMAPRPMQPAGMAPRPMGAPPAAPHPAQHEGKPGRPERG